MNKALSFVAPFAVFCILSVSGFAQKSEGDQQQSAALSRWHLGLHGGTTFTMFDANTQYAYDRRYDGKIGSVAGLSFGYDVTEWFTVRVALDMVEKNYQYHRSLAFSGIYCQYRNTYLDLPILADFSFGGNRLRGHALAGGYVGYWSGSFMCGQDIAVDDSYENITHYQYRHAYVFDNNRDNRFDGGLAAGLGISFAPISQLRLPLEGMLYYVLTSTTRQYMRIADYRYLTTGTIQLGIEYQF